MNTPQYQELQNAIDFLRKTLANVKMNLDYSVDSVKHLDYILEDAFKKGKLKNPNGPFAQQQGIIMLGMTGYLVEVVIQNTNNSKVEIDPNDEQWYVNLKLTGEKGWTIQPGLRVMKRAYTGSEAELYAYVLSAIKYFNQVEGNAGDSNAYIQEVYVREDPLNGKKPWWKESKK
jgi:hypothetical protein